MRLKALTLALSLVAAARPAQAWDWSAPFVVRDDARITPRLELAATSLLPLSALPREVHGFGGLLRGVVSYVDDDKMATFEIASADFHMTYRSDRDRYDFGSFPSVALFALDSQLRLTPGAHLLYGAALARSGAMTHATAAGLTFRLGLALPFFGRQAETMSDYRRAYLQVETLPLVGSFLADLSQEGFFDFEQPTVQLGGEVALMGRLETRIGTFSAESRLSVSYHHQRSMYLRIGLHWTGHTFWRRFAGTVQSQYILPMRPLRTHISEDDQELAYQHHLTLSIGLRIYLGDPPRPRPDHTFERRREHFQQRWSEQRELRELRQGQRHERLQERRDGRRGRRDERRDEEPPDWVQ